nr:hypothetical protein [Tanacetum cinerariifolium]
GKENGVNILKSIDEGPFWMGTLRETLTEGAEGSLHLGPERLGVYSDLTSEEKDRVDRIEDRGTMHRVQVQLVMGELRTELGGQDNVVDDDVDKQPIQDLALTVDNVFQANDCDVFDSDVDEAPTAQTMFMANLSSADPVYDEAGSSYDSNVLFEVHDHYQNVVCEHYEVHEMHDDVQPNYVVDSYTSCTSDSNMISYDQYVKDNAVQVIQSDVSAVPNDAYMMILNDMHEPPAQHVYVTTQTKKENQYLEEFLDMKALKEKVEDKLFKQDQSLQTVHMLCKPKPYYDEQRKAAIGYKSPLYLARAKQVQPALYNGHEIIKTDHVLAIMHNSEDSLEIAKITRKKMNEKRKTPLWTHHKINIRPPDYSKENFLTTFAPQAQLTPEHIFWSKDVLIMKTKALKEQAKAAKPVKALTLYPPNTHDGPDFDSVFEIKKLKASIQEKDNVIRKLRTQISQMLETCSDANRTLNFRALDFQITQNNREVHLDYLKHLKESVATLREIVEEAKVERPFDRSVASTCLYTKRSQELLEYVIGTCLKGFNKRDKKQATTPLNRKKQVTFADQCRTDRPLVFGLRLLKTYDRGSLMAQEFHEKVHRDRMTKALPRKRFKFLLSRLDTMVDMNIPANDAPAEQAHAVAPPTRTDDQILPSSNWVPIGKSNCVLNVKKSQRNPIFPIAFNLHKDILKDALDITPTNDNNPFVAPPSSDTIIEYVNMLGYPSTLRNVSTMSVNALYQPWRAILSMINMCLTGKTAGYDRPRHPVLKNLAIASRGKKKTTHLVISSVRFTKLIIHHLKTKHNIHPRSGLPLHYSHDENILNTLRYIGKDGREIFGMPIPDALLTDEIKGSPYYGEGEATESPKATKVTKLKAAKVTKPASDPKLKPAPTQLSKAIPEKKQKLVQETLDEPSPAKRSKGGLVRKICKPASLLKKPDSGRIQPLLDLQGKGKKKVVDEQAAHDLLTLQTPNIKSPVDQFIFQKRTLMPTEASRPIESPSLDTELALTNSETEYDDIVRKINTRDQDEGQAGPNPGIQDKGQAGPNPSIQDEGQAGSNPGDAAKSQPQSKFTTTAYPNVQENLKLPSEDPVIPKELASSTGTLSSLQNLKKQLSFTNQFFVEKKQEEEPRKTNAEAEVSKAVDEIVTDAVGWAMQAPLRACFSDLPAVDIKEILQKRMFKDKSYEAQEDHKKLYDALKKSLERDYSDQLLSNLEEARQKKRKRRDIPRTPSGSLPPQPPPPPPPTGVSGALGTSRASRSSQFPLPPPPSTGTSKSAQQQGNKALSSSKSAASAPQSMAWTTSDIRFKSAGLSGTQELSPTNSNDDSIHNEQATTLVSAYETPVENSLLAKTGDMTNFLNCSRWRSVTRCSQTKLTGWIQIEIKSESIKGSSPALLISKMKAASYPDFGLELLVPEQINKVRSTMQILSVVRIKAYSRYGCITAPPYLIGYASFPRSLVNQRVANSSAGATQQLSIRNASSLAMAKYSSSGIFITDSGNDLSILFLTILP